MSATHRLFWVGVSQCGCPVYWKISETLHTPESAAERVAALNAANDGRQFTALPVIGPDAGFFGFCEHYDGGPGLPFIPGERPKFGYAAKGWPFPGWKPNPQPAHCEACGKWLQPGEGLGVYSHPSDVDEEDADILGITGGWSVWCADRAECHTRAVASGRLDPEEERARERSEGLRDFDLGRRYGV